MANNYGVANTTFKPFSFEEMLKPALMATEAHEKLEKEKDALEETAVLSAMDFKGSNYENQFNNYLNSLTDITNDLNKGDLSNAKRKIKSVKDYYLKTLVPASQRITKLNALRDEQNKKQEANPFIRFSVDFRDKTEDDITASSDYTAYDLSKIYSQVANNTLAKIASEYRQSVGDPIQIGNSYLVEQGYGMTQEEYNEQLQDPNSELNAYINEQVKHATQGITNEDIVDEITDGVKKVIKSNIGKFETKVIKGDSNDSLAWSKLQLERDKFDWEKHKWEFDNNDTDTSNGNDTKKEKGDPYYDLKTMPANEGASVIIDTWDIDEKLRVDDDRPEETKTIDGIKRTGLKKYSWAEIAAKGVEGVDKNYFIELTNGKEEDLPYYDFYYEDTDGYGGTLHMVKKDEKTIKNIMVNQRSQRRKNEASGFVKKNGAVYYADSNGKILDSPLHVKLHLNEAELKRYNSIISNLEEGEYISKDGSKKIQIGRTTNDTTKPEQGGDKSNSSQEVVL